jgi:hypothetical protein
MVATRLVPTRPGAGRYSLRLARRYRIVSSAPEIANRALGERVMRENAEFGAINACALQFGHGTLEPFRIAETATTSHIAGSLISAAGMCPGDEANYERAKLLATLQLGQLTFRFFARKAVSLLDLANQLIALSLNDLPIIVGQPAPFFLGLAD